MVTVHLSTCCSRKSAYSRTNVGGRSDRRRVQQLGAADQRGDLNRQRRRRKPGVLLPAFLRRGRPFANEKAAGRRRHLERIELAERARLDACRHASTTGNDTSSS